jgi:hypothetical protein
MSRQKPTRPAAYLLNDRRPISAKPSHNTGRIKVNERLKHQTLLNMSPVRLSIFSISYLLRP